VVPLPDTDSAVVVTLPVGAGSKSAAETPVTGSLKITVNVAPACAAVPEGVVRLIDST
jgi:hypothetical protein